MVKSKTEQFAEAVTHLVAMFSEYVEEAEYDGSEWDVDDFFTYWANGGRG